MPREWEDLASPVSGDERELPPDVTIARIAEMGSLVGDPARANMLVALLENRTLTARQLADRAGVTPQTASGHLAKLKAAGLVRMDRVGRCRVHSLGSIRTVGLLEAMHLAGLESDAHGRKPDLDLRIARICHDHLGGRLAVDLASVLAEGGAEHPRLSREGRARLALWGLDPTFLSTAHAGCDQCLDWSERRPHLAGSIGAAILDRGLSLGWLSRRPGHRALSLTAAGSRGFHQRFGISAQAWKT